MHSTWSACLGVGVGVGVALSQLAVSSAAPGSGQTAPAVLSLPEHPLVRLPSVQLKLGTSPTELVEVAESCNRRAQTSLCTPEQFSLELSTHQEHTVASFYLERTEVSLLAYNRCVRAGRCRSPREFPSHSPQASDPVTGVSWEDAHNYCAFHKLRLPTEIEWERAARGASRRPYPWGRHFHAQRVNGGSFSLERVRAEDGYEGLAPAHSFPQGATPEGLLHLIGNVAEWTATAWGDAAPSAQLVNHRITKGGHFASAPPALRAAAREPQPPDAQLPTLGFRCARSDFRALEGFSAPPAP